MKAKQTKFAVWYQHIFYSNFFLFLIFSNDIFSSLNFLSWLNHSSKDLGISGLTTLTFTSEKLNTKTSATGTVTHDLSTGSVFYHSSISNNFTANFTNVPTTNDRALGVTLVLAQGVTPYMSTALQIDGSAQTIKWVNNTTPTGTASKVDIVGFSFIRTGSAWTVLGQYSTYG